jgi:hypothetical protein
MGLMVLRVVFDARVRASMIRRRDPGPYEDRFGPVALTILLVISIVVNFSLKVYEVYKR